MCILNAEWISDLALNLNRIACFFLCSSKTISAPPSSKPIKISRCSSSSFKLIDFLTIFLLWSRNRSIFSIESDALYHIPLHPFHNHLQLNIHIMKGRIKWLQTAFSKLIHKSLCNLKFIGLCHDLNDFMDHPPWNRAPSDGTRLLDASFNRCTEISNCEDMKCRFSGHPTLLDHGVKYLSTFCEFSVLAQIIRQFGCKSKIEMEPNFRQKCGRAADKNFILVAKTKKNWKGQIIKHLSGNLQGSKQPNKYTSRPNIKQGANSVSGFVLANTHAMDGDIGCIPLSDPLALRVENSDKGALLVSRGKIQEGSVLTQGKKLLLSLLPNEILDTAESRSRRKFSLIKVDISSKNYLDRARISKQKSSWKLQKLNRRPFEIRFQQTYSRTERLGKTNPTTPNSTQSEPKWVQIKDPKRCWKVQTTIWITKQFPNVTAPEARREEGNKRVRDSSSTTAGVRQATARCRNFARLPPGLQVTPEFPPASK
ncbi:hypothetical protein M5K25_017729 [Dendrobium thyrsiflorum]|uniref:Uncharacterized protein n=1 Tax=Dendrobium thyrsiflorum TaxID=117978 RepID=A0ABD0UVA4_DENTH